MWRKQLVWLVVPTMSVVMAFGTPALFGSAATPGEEVYYPPDVQSQFEAITDRADAMGFWLGDAPFDPSLCRHWQGVARSSGPGTPYMFASRSGNQPPVPCLQWCDDWNVPCTEVGDGPGHLVVVRMGSRDVDGERLRSNRLVRDTETEDSRPDTRDRVVSTITFDGTDGWPNYGHPGGLQLIGDVLAVPLETPYGGDPDMNEVVFIDVSNPETPTFISSMPVQTSDDFTAGLVAITTQPNGHYLMLLAGLANKEVRFFESDGTDLKDPTLTWSPKHTWFPEDDPVDPGCQLVPPSPTFPDGVYRGWPDGGLFDVAHQSLNFVREGSPNGDLFLIGGRSTSQVPGLGEDWFDLFRVVPDGSEFTVECVSVRHVHSFPASDGALLFHNNIAHFAAASGAYVSPTGELILYATEHDNDGPGGTVKFGEWRHTDMTRPGSPTLDPTVTVAGPYTVAEGSSVDISAVGAPPRTKAWVELWTDPDWTDDRYLVVDYPDWALDDFDDFEELDDAKNNPFADGFSDQATSARWFAPVGCTIQLRNNDLSDSEPGSDTRTIPGSGTVGSDDHLGSLDDDITAVVFFSDCDTYYDPATLGLTWDLDGDSSYESTGSPVTFSAALLDGPAVVSPGVRVTHPSDGRTGTDTATVTVVNVAPIVSSIDVADSLGREVPDDVGHVMAGLPTTLSAVFDDAGLPDTHQVTIDWGDGSSSTHADLDGFTAATGAGTGSFKDAHVYATPGIYDIVATITDDDGGATPASVSIEVLDAAGAIESVVEDLESLQGAAGEEQAAALQAVIDALIGSQSGGAMNGALDKLSDGDLNAALVHLHDAVVALEEAEALTGFELEGLEATLGLAAHVIAVTAQADALDALDSPSRGEQRQLDRISSAITEGANLLQSDAWLDGIEAFRVAVQIAVDLLD